MNTLRGSRGLCVTLNATGFAIMPSPDGHGTPAVPNGTPLYDAFTIVYIFVDIQSIQCYTYIIKKGDKKMLALRLPEEIEKRLTRLASITNRTKSYYAREAIIRHLTDLEDIYLAETRLEDTKAGRSRTFTLDELEKDIGLDR